MTDRIQKILSARGLCSRRQAESWITEGRVTCNGTVCTLGQTADPDKDIICVDAVQIPCAEKRVYLMLHKPRGYVTTLCDEKGRKNAAQLVEDCSTRVYPVGRLDMDSEGLLLFTNDGDFAQKLMHPSHQVEKTYVVTVDGLTRESVDRLLRPMTLDGYRLRIPKVEVLANAQLQITIHEGRNRQVRRMCAVAGMRVKRLVRVREGCLTLGDLPAGKWRYLTDAEVKQLLK